MSGCPYYAAWVKATAWNNAYTSIISRTELGGAIATLLVKSNGKLAIYLAGTGGTVDYDGSGTYTLSTGVWYHVAFTYDSVNGLVGYVNGNVDQTAGANGTLVTTTEDIWIGAHPTIPGRYHYGLIDEVAIWNSSLNSTQIADLAAGSITPGSLSPVGLWRLEEGAGTTTADGSGNGNNGTLNEGVTWSTDVSSQLT